jgi:hypothetical protein
VVSFAYGQLMSHEIKPGGLKDGELRPPGLTLVFYEDIWAGLSNDVESFVWVLELMATWSQNIEILRATPQMDDFLDYELQFTPIRIDRL